MYFEYELMLWFIKIPFRFNLFTNLTTDRNINFYYNLLLLMQT